MASSSSSGTIAHWQHEPLHDIVEPMTDHVIMAYNGSNAARGAAVRKIGGDRNVSFLGCVIIIPAGIRASRWDIPKPVDVVQLYLPPTTLERVADEAERARADQSAGTNGAS